MAIQVHIKKIVHMGWADEKAQPKTKTKLCTIIKYLPSQLTYLPSLTYPPRSTYVPTYLSTYLYE
jgi:hypothetical protein